MQLTTAFLAEYDTMVKVKSESFRKTYANYLNFKTGFNKSYDDYIEMYNNCELAKVVPMPQYQSSFIMYATEFESGCEDSIYSLASQYAFYTVRYEKSDTLFWEIIPSAEGVWNKWSIRDSLLAKQHEWSCMSLAAYPSTHAASSINFRTLNSACASDLEQWLSQYQNTGMAIDTQAISLIT